MSEDVPSIVTVFPEVEKNLTLVKWKHAVNNLALLNEALNSSAHMLEADVSINREKKTTMMAHSSEQADTSDLSLENFLNITTRNNKKGIKLDFKSRYAFTLSVLVLRNFTDQLKIPVWLNADILQGPQGNNNSEINDEIFIEEASKVLPGIVLSLGWTTKPGVLDNSTLEYTKANIDAMLKSVERVNQTQAITYAMRAGLLVNTELDLIKNLLKDNGTNPTMVNRTLTIWSGTNDTVDAAKLSKLILDIGKSRVYVDVPEDLESKLNLRNSGNNISGSLGLMSSIVFSILLSRALSK